MGRAGRAEFATSFTFIVAVAMLYVECHTYDLVPNFKEGRALCKVGNELENSE